jgi:hypothetical protein
MSTKHVSNSSNVEKCDYCYAMKCSKKHQNKNKTNINSHIHNENCQHENCQHEHEHEHEDEDENESIDDFDSDEDLLPEQRIILIGTNKLLKYMNVCMVAATLMMCTYILRKKSTNS